MQGWQRNLFVVTALFALSLLGAFVLFYFLDSGGKGKYQNISIEGALTGFVVIYLLLSMTFSRLRKQTSTSFEVEFNLVPKPGETLQLVEPKIFYQVGGGQKKEAQLAKVHKDYKVRVSGLRAEDDVTIWVEDAGRTWQTDTVRSNVRHLALQKQCAEGDCRVGES